jgi:uncharacterized protein
MNAVALRFYVHQPRKHGKVLLFEWLLERAKELGIHGGSAFFAEAGYGATASYTSSVSSSCPRCCR